MLDVKEALQFLKGAIALGPKGQQVRNDMIRSANEFCTAILLCAGYTSNRLNQALLAKNRGEKLALISRLKSQELEAFSRTNALCADIHSSANALRHWSSSEWANVNLGGHADARALFDRLSQGEGGMQRLFEELIAAPADLSNLHEAQIDEWVHRTVARATAISQDTNSVIGELADLI